MYKKIIIILSLIGFNISSMEERLSIQTKLDQDDLSQQFFNAIKNNNIEQVRQLISKDSSCFDVGALTRIVNNQNKDGLKPIHWAAFYGNTDIAQLLIDAGADINAKTNTGNTPLHWAVSYGNKDIVELLINACADLSESRALADMINAKDIYGHTPLHWGARRGDIEIAQLLIDSGANVNAQDNNGGTALHWIAEEGCIGIVELLLKSGIDKDIKITRACYINKTAADVANERGFKEIKDLINSLNYNKHIEQVVINTILQIIKSDDSEANKMNKIVNIIKNNIKAVINYRDNNGNTLLHLAAKSSEATITILEHLIALTPKLVPVTNKPGEVPMALVSGDNNYVEIFMKASGLTEPF